MYVPKNIQHIQHKSTRNSSYCFDCWKIEHSEINVESYMSSQFEPNKSETASFHVIKCEISTVNTPLFDTLSISLF